MRFGITAEMGSNSQTVLTCMRGCDDADIFIGFFGARYGSSTLVRKHVGGGIVLDGSTDTIKLQHDTKADVFSRSNRIYVRISKEQSGTPYKEYLIKSYNEATQYLLLDASIPADEVPTEGNRYNLMESNGHYLIHARYTIPH